PPSNAVRRDRPRAVVPVGSPATSGSNAPFSLRIAPCPSSPPSAAGVARPLQAKTHSPSATRFSNCRQSDSFFILGRPLGVETTPGQRAGDAGLLVLRWLNARTGLNPRRAVLKMTVRLTMP